jgi:hypothetical protein
MHLLGTKYGCQPATTTTKSRLSEHVEEKRAQLDTHINHEDEVEEPAHLGKLATIAQQQGTGGYSRRTKVATSELRREQKHEKSQAWPALNSRTRFEQHDKTNCKSKHLPICNKERR